MATQKIYAGAKLRELRTRIGLTQKDFAAKLGVSLPYLNQMENNNRPVSTSVVLALAREFGLDVTELSVGDSERLVSDMREVLSDPVFSNDMPPIADLRLAASNAPALARAFIELHQSYRQTHERLASLDEALGREDARTRPSPWEEVRDFFHYCDNYIDAVDRAAEHFVTSNDGGANLRVTAIKALSTVGIKVTFIDDDRLRSFDPETKTLRISDRAAPETQTFQILLQVALVRQNALLEATLDLARFQTSEARGIAKIGLANYFAGAALMPYTAFLSSAKENRHDLELLAGRFGASIEQVRAQRAFPFSLSAWIRPVQSPNAIPQPAFSSPDLVGPAPCGTCTAPLNCPPNSCANWPRHQTVCAMSAWRGTCPSQRDVTGPLCAAMPSLWVARSNMPDRWFTLMAWTSTAQMPLNLSAFPVGYASARPAINALSRRLSAS
jgi:transcriptional regulator with XRE-family HTH domain